MKKSVITTNVLKVSCLVSECIDFKRSVFRKNDSSRLKQTFLKRIAILMIALFSASFAQGTTYYLTLTGAGAAQTATNWNTIAGGGGTTATNFITPGDIFLFLSGSTELFRGTGFLEPKPAIQPPIWL